ncbi:MAG: DUF167 family protein [Nitrososphaerota archaeon]|jgi:uncharacterized protein (TIGR00251 family)|uniref:DUF167 family protein n=1 Tax=Candidatus Bathycorpusculum sp. TaxID=2994959 RepID=UPI0028210BD2|nr:DUF167 family protein [Candidatus Termitimicrobium sp.]MCL2432129.1 DUF167 family protein [Candidatus Termitimicrobium sp.]MDR0492987.1 DUF167 family protein [Nitrososphaerota archaeon]
MNIKETDQGIIITIFVKPNSSKFKIERSNEEIVVHATEEPEKGKVNREILKEFTKLFHTQVELISGITSKEKKLLIKDIDKNDLDKTLPSEPS